MEFARFLFIKYLIQKTLEPAFMFARCRMTWMGVMSCQKVICARFETADMAEA